VGTAFGGFSVEVTDPKVPSGKKSGVGKAIGTPKTLVEIKGSKVVCGFGAGAAGRLSVVPLSPSTVWGFLTGE